MDRRTQKMMPITQAKAAMTISFSVMAAPFRHHHVEIAGSAHPADLRHHPAHGLALGSAAPARHYGLPLAGSGFKQITRIPHAHLAPPFLFGLPAHRRTVCDRIRQIKNDLPGKGSMLSLRGRLDLLSQCSRHVQRNFYLLIFVLVDFLIHAHTVGHGAHVRQYYFVLFFATLFAHSMSEYKAANGKEASHVT